jgi:hypothetical protein
METDHQKTESQEPVDSASPVQPQKVPLPLLPLLIAIIFIVVVSVIFGNIHMPASYKERLETRAQKRLRDIGSAQLAYQGSNNKKFYGSFHALQEMGFIESGFGLDDYLDGYDLDWYIKNFYDRSYGLACGLGSNTFTIVAYPRIIPPPALRTFGITEEQDIRVYNPDNGNQFVSRDDPWVKTWDPVL